MLSLMFRLMFFISAMLISRVVLADSTYGDLANSVMGPVAALISVLDSISIICGAGMIMGSLFKYLSYRKNSSATPISVPIVMFIAGVGLVLLGFVPFGDQ